MIIKSIVFVGVPPDIPPGAAVTINPVPAFMANPDHPSGKVILTPASSFVYVPLTSVGICALASPKESEREKKAADRSAATKTEECLCFIALKLSDLIFKQIASNGFVDIVHFVEKLISNPESLKKYRPWQAIEKYCFLIALLLPEFYFDIGTEYRHVKGASFDPRQQYSNQLY
jgi:hypothetical protein